MSNFAQKMAGGMAKQSKQSAQAIAKRIAQEQLETLKSAKIQLGAPSAEVPQSAPLESPVQAPSNQTTGESHEQMTQRLNLESKKLLEKLEGELAQIRQKKQQEQLQKSQVEEQQKVTQVQQEQAKVKEAPTLMGKMRRAVGGMGAKVKNMAGRREQQKNVSG